MTQETAEFLNLASEYFGNQKCSICSDYSGRLMYGKTTYAIVVENVMTLFSDTMNYVKEEVENNEPLIIPEFCSFRLDNLGKGVVIY